MIGWRSLLFVPANDAKRLARVHERGADAVILDLEDAVAAEAKTAARASIPSAVADLLAKGVEVVVRINGPWLLAVPDLQAAVRAGAAVVIAPKISSAGRVEALAEMLDEAEAEAGVARGTTGLIALIESPLAFDRLMAIAAVERVTGLALGSEDFSQELGAPPTPESLDLPCKLIALAAAGRGKMALGLPISITEFRDREAYAAAAAHARAVGMTGALCIHPAQVELVNACFTPNKAERAEAAAVLAAWDAARAEGRAVTAHAGRMIDAPVVERARRLLARSEAASGARV